MQTSTLPSILATTSALWLAAGGSSTHVRDARGVVTKATGRRSANAAEGVTLRACFGTREADVIKALRIDRMQVAQVICGRHLLL